MDQFMKDMGDMVAPKEDEDEDRPHLYGACDMS